jgi:valyl-tRNA synthetase
MSNQNPIKRRRKMNKYIAKSILFSTIAACALSLNISTASAMYKQKGDNIQQSEIEQKGDPVLRSRLIQEIVRLKSELFEKHEKVEEKLKKIYLALSIELASDEFRNSNKDSLVKLKENIIQNQDEVIKTYKKFVQSFTTLLPSGCSIDDLSVLIKTKSKLEKLKNEFQWIENNLAKANFGLIG